MTLRRIIIVSALLAAACRRDATDAVSGEQNWSVTTWGTEYEIFAEVGPLVAGEVSQSNTHVTVLDDFSPLRKGIVTAVLRETGRGESAFEQSAPKRDGIFVVPIRPPSEGEFELSFRIQGPGGPEEIPAGRVRVGTREKPGGLVKPPAPPNGSVTAEAEGIPFLKEQQWRTEFATAWAAERPLASTVSGPARVVPVAGGEVVLTAPVDAAVASEPWPHRGEDVGHGKEIFRLVPKVAASSSLPQLEAEVASIEADLAVTRARAERLADLEKLDAVSRAEVERIRAARSALEARLTAARRDLETAAAGRLGERAGASLPIRAPWPGRVAEVNVSPGQSVAAGAALARLVKPRPVWLDIALRPEGAAQLQEAPSSLFIRRPSATEPSAYSGSAIRLISRAPEVDSRTGTVGVLIEVEASSEELPIGSAVEAELAVGGETRGVVVPAAALVDDSGITVVYEQVDGEAFARHPVSVRARQGALALVEGVPPGTRLVTKGAAAVRRASLLSSGAPEGHVH
jgi:RND family efflux transporter MFP subunit